MRRLLILLSLLAVTIFNSGYSGLNTSNAIYEEIKAQTIKGIKDYFKKDISIGKAGGIIIGQVVFEDVSFAGQLTAKKVYINYNPIVFALKKDIVPAISKITIKEGRFKISRNKQNEWNFNSLLPPEEPGGPPPPPFRAKLVFDNCVIDYQDALGYGKKPTRFDQEIKQVNGIVSFQKKDKISIDLKGVVEDKTVSSPASIKGGVDYSTSTFQFDIKSEKLALKKWSKYAVPFLPIKASAGQVDVNLKLSQAKTKAWPVALAGNFTFLTAEAQFDQYSFSKVNGQLLIDDENLTFKNLKTNLNGLPIKINGSLKDFKEQKLNLIVSLYKLDLKKIPLAFSQIKQLDLQGAASGPIKITGTINRPLIKGQIDIFKGVFYNQAFSGRSNFSFQDKKLKVEVPFAYLYQGKAIGNVDLDFSEPIPIMSVDSKLEKISLASLSQNAPGIAGQANGKFQLSGPINDLSGDLDLNLSQATLLGQSLQKVKSSLQIKDGNIHLTDFFASSETASLQSSGTISRDLNFNFLATAKGIRLRGHGLFGSMEATVNHFKGSISWLLDNEFLNSPLKNLNASGEALITNGRIGEQSFDRAEGKINMGQGEIVIDHVNLKNNTSILYASGQAGIGVPTKLKISGKKVALSDLKILNHLVPDELKNSQGTTDLDFEITGQIPKEARFVSLAPLANLKLSGKVKITEALVADLPLKEGQATFSWDRNNLTIKDGQLKNDTAKLDFSLNYNKESKIKGRFNGTVNLAQTKKLLHKYGNFDGLLELNLELEGKAEDPQIKANFRAQRFKFNKSFFDKVEGSFNYSQKTLKLSSPVSLTKGESQYKVSGSLDLAPILAKQNGESFLDLKVEIPSADLQSAARLIENLRSELTKQPQAKIVRNRVIIKLPATKIVNSQPFTREKSFKLYGANGKKTYFLEDWAKSIAATKKEERFIPVDLRFGGKLSGRLVVQGKLKNLAGGFSGQVEDGFFQDFSFASLKTQATLKDKMVNLKHFELNKENGKLAAQGEFNLNGEDLNLKVNANKMSFKILRILFNEDFDGNFNLEANLSGSLQNPIIAATLSGKKIRLAKIPFDNISLSINKKAEYLYLNEVSLTEKKKTSKIRGLASLNPEGKIKIEAYLKDNAIGLLNLFTDEINWQHGLASVEVLVTGKSGQPQINGTLEVENANLYVRAIDSGVRKITGKAKIKNNRINIEKLTGDWYGKSSRDRHNLLGLSGSLDLSPLFTARKSVGLALVFDPMYLQVDLPKLFIGTVKTKKSFLTGYLPLQLARGRQDPSLRPTLTGQANVSDAVISLSQNRSPQDKIFPINYNLTIALDKNIYAVMGDVFTTDLSTIFMNLEIRSKELKITGSSLTPSLLGKIDLRRGTLNIFNRDFELLNTEQQEKFYPYNPEKITANTASFSGKKGSEGVKPKVAITAKTEVENVEKDSSGQKTRTKVIILSNLKGLIGATDKEDELKIGFAAFVEDKTKSPSEFVAATYSEDQIKVMLLPDFIKSLAASDDEDQVDSKVILADYLSSRVQTYVFRNIERNLEQSLGLESLTLEYNLGKKLRQDMGVQDINYEEEPNWRVGFVKGFFDKLYVDVRYQAFDEETSSDNPAFIYQLTYKLSPVWSIIYYREPPTLAELTTGYQKVTLKAGFSFW